MWAPTDPTVLECGGQGAQQAEAHAGASRGRHWLCSGVSPDPSCILLHISCDERQVLTTSWHCDTIASSELMFMSIALSRGISLIGHFIRQARRSTSTSRPRSCSSCSQDSLTLCVEPVHVDIKITHSRVTLHLPARKLH